MDGYEVCKRIKAAYAEDEYREKSRAAGCHLHLVKPVPVHVLEELLA